MAKKKAEQKDSSFEIPQMERTIKINRQKKLTNVQQDILKTVLDDKTNIVIIEGPAGTAKTYIAVYAALQEIVSKGKSLLYLRSIVESARQKLGALPGAVYEKFGPFATPLEDKLEEFLHPHDANFLKENGYISPLPINYLRGASWRDKIVIIDEAQNLTRENLLTALTRAGEGTKVIICGDMMQPDIGDSGLREVCDKFKDKDSEDMGIYRFVLGVDDIVRSKLVKFIVSKFQQQ